MNVVFAHDGLQWLCCVDLKSFILYTTEHNKFELLSFTNFFDVNGNGNVVVEHGTHRATGKARKRRLGLVEE